MEVELKVSVIITIRGLWIKELRGDQMSKHLYGKTTVAHFQWLWRPAQGDECPYDQL